jgi:hypothetical protein
MTFPFDTLKFKKKLTGVGMPVALFYLFMEVRVANAK